METSSVAPLTNPSVSSAWSLRKFFHINIQCHAVPVSLTTDWRAAVYYTHLLVDIVKHALVMLLLRKLSDI